jgi:hypothetical protein
VVSHRTAGYKVLAQLVVLSSRTGFTTRDRVLAAEQPAAAGSKRSRRRQQPVLRAPEAVARLSRAAPLRRRLRHEYEGVRAVPEQAGGPAAAWRH